MLQAHILILKVAAAAKIWKRNLAFPKSIGSMKSSIGLSGVVRAPLLPVVIFVYFIALLRLLTSLLSSLVL